MLYKNKVTSQKIMVRYSFIYSQLVKGFDILVDLVKMFLLQQYQRNMFFCVLCR